MSERIRGSYDDALHKSTYTLHTLQFLIQHHLFVKLILVYKQIPTFKGS